MCVVLGVFCWLQLAGGTVRYAALSAPLLLIAGAGLASVATAPPPVLGLRDQPRGLNGPWQLRGQVDREPEQTTEGSTFRLELRAVRLDDAWVATSGAVAVSLDEPADAGLTAGTEVEAFLRLRLPRPPLNPRQSPRATLRPPQLRASLKSYRQLRIRRAAAPTLASRARSAARSALGRELPTEAPVATALLLGERGRVPDRLSIDLARTGLGHLLAISGLHLGVAVGSCVLLARVAGASPRAGVLVGLIAALMIPGLVVPRASVVRAAVMAGLALGARAAGWRVEPLDCLALALFLILLADPAAAADLGLALSATAVAGLLLALPGRRGRAPYRWLAAPLAAQAAVAPLVASIGAQVAFAGVLMNLVAVPLLALTIPLLIAVAVSSGLSLEPLPELLAGAAELAIAAIRQLAVAGNQLPGAAIAVPSASWWAGALWWAGLVTLLAAPARISNRAGRVSCRGLGLALAAGAVAAATTPPPAPSETRLVLFDVGQGDALLLQSASDAVLIDAGGYPGIDYDVGAHLVAPALRRLGIRRLTVAAGSHAHADHYGGLPYVLRYHPAGEVWLAPTPPQSRLQAEVLRSSPRSIRLTPARQQRLGGCTWTPQPPPREALTASARRVSNEASLVLAVVCGPRAVLLTGDAGRVAEPGWQLHELRGGVLKVGHHASASATSPELLRRMAPRHAVVSVGARNAFGLPHPDVMRRLRDLPAATYRTDRDGAITVRLGSRVRVSGTRWRSG